MDCQIRFPISSRMHEYEIEHTVKSPSHLDRLPLELIYLIIDHLALQATSQTKYFEDVKSLAIAWIDREKSPQADNIHFFVHQTLFFSRITACNRNLVSPKDLEIHTFSHLALFLEVVNKRLYSLNLKQFGLQINDQSLAQIVEYCPHLEELNLGSASITGSGIDSLVKLRRLHTLTLCALKLEAKDFNKLTRLQLKELHISGGPQLLNSHIEAFSNEFPLKTLSLINCSKLTSECFLSFSKMALRSLVFTQKSYSIPNMSGDSNNFFGIHHLDLSRTKLTKESMEMIAKCKNLQTLILDECADLTDSMLDMIVALPLKKLSVSKCKKLTDHALRSIAKISSLEELILAYCQHFTDEGVKELASLNLKAVNIGWCFYLSNETIQLFDRKAIQEVQATECPYIEPEKLHLSHLQIADSQYKIFKREKIE